jgi:peptidoglycan hydrolase-like protein with peptidoglycan-binding domain
MGAKGKEVRALQEKLIEMGYLPEGSADGAYGRKTFNAVKKFQYYNGLTADGIAGRKTQTNLFENEYAAANPEVTPTPEPTAAAIATPAPADVPETKEPEAEAEETAEAEPEAPEAETAETEAPEAETAESGEAETEEPEAGPSATEAPEVTRAPGAGIKKAESAAQSPELLPAQVPAGTLIQCRVIDRDSGSLQRFCQPGRILTDALHAKTQSLQTESAQKSIHRAQAAAEVFVDIGAKPHEKGKLSELFKTRQGRQMCPVPGK